MTDHRKTLMLHETRVVHINDHLKLCAIRIGSMQTFTFTDKGTQEVRQRVAYYLHKRLTVWDWVNRLMHRNPPVFQVEKYLRVNFEELLPYFDDERSIEPGRFNSSFKVVEAFKSFGHWFTHGAKTSGATLPPFDDNNYAVGIITIGRKFLAIDCFARHGIRADFDILCVLGDSIEELLSFLSDIYGGNWELF